MNSVSSNAVYNVLRTVHNSLRAEDLIIPAVSQTVASLAPINQQGIRINRVSNHVFKMHFEPLKFTLGQYVTYFGVLEVTQALAHFYGVTSTFKFITESTVLITNETKGISSAAALFSAWYAEDPTKKYVAIRYGVTGTVWEPGDVLALTGDIDLVV